MIFKAMDFWSALNVETKDKLMILFAFKILIMSKMFLCQIYA